MLVFIVPIKSPAISRSWTRVTTLYSRCLQSLCAQTSSDFRVIVVANEFPLIEFTHQNIVFEQINLPIPELTRWSQNADKTKKIIKGIERSEEFEPSFIMPVDADDCVSRRLAEYVNRYADDRSIKGWSLTRGYLYKENSMWAWLNLKNFNNSCGSSAIFRPEVSSAMFYDISYEEEPGKTCFRYNFERPRVALDPLPFIGAVYSILNEENIFMDNQRVKMYKRRESFIYFYIRKALKYVPVPVTARWRKEFGFYPLPSSAQSCL